MINQKLANEAIKRLKKAEEIGDEETGHVDADRVLCDLLIELGYQSVVDAFDDVSKWYA